MERDVRFIDGRDFIQSATSPMIDYVIYDYQKQKVAAIYSEGEFIVAIMIGDENNVSAISVGDHVSIEVSL